MYVRLAFSVAAHLDAEILLIDEVLAVGDAPFQKKCIGTMGRFADRGRTVLFVSHNMTAVQALCQRVIWLNDGVLAADGAAGQVITGYLKTSSSTSREKTWPDGSKAPGNEHVRLRRAAVRPQTENGGDSITIRTPFTLEFDYWNLEPDSYLNLSVVLYNEQGVVVLVTAPVAEPLWHGKSFPVGLFRSVCFFPGDLLNDGTYRISLLVVKGETMIIYQLDDILEFDVLDDPDRRGRWYGKWVGVVRPDLKWTTELMPLQASDGV